MPVNPSITIETNQLYAITDLFLASKDIPPAPQFLKNNLFGTVEATWGEQIAVDYQRGSSRAAAFCTPYKRGIAIPRSRFRTTWVTPPDIKVTSDIRALDARYRVAGESQYSTLSSQERMASLQVFDYNELDAQISRAEEAMCAECLFYGSVTCLDGDDRQVVQKIDYGPVNEVVVPPAEYWDATPTGPNPFSHLQLLKRHVTASGYPANLFVLGVDAADAFLGHEAVRTASNFFNFRQATIDVKTYTDYENFGVNVLGNFQGMDLLSYEGMYENPIDGKMHYFMPPDHVLIASTALQNRFAYGRVTQVESGQTIPGIQDFQAPRVPQYVADPDEDALKFRLWSRPLPIPVNTMTWAIMKVCDLSSVPLDPVPLP